MSVFQEDVLSIVQETINSGLDGEELVTEIKNRLDLYNKGIKKRIDDFNR